jgi:hypothetical protein
MYSTGDSLPYAMYSTCDFLCLMLSTVQVVPCALCSDSTGDLLSYAMYSADGSLCLMLSTVQVTPCLMYITGGTVSCYVQYMCTCGTLECYL